jgi:molybdopterin synthase catalytic subunit/molybdopterin converting factor small subunit
MRVQIMLFGVLREHARTGVVELELGDGSTVADALERLRTSGPLSQLLGRLQVCMAVNRSYATPQTVLSAGDELALIPPLSGGAELAGERSGSPGEAAYVRITEEPLSLEEITRSVGRAGAGAIVIFEGVTREVSRLDYEAYTAMAEESLRVIAGECRARHGLEAIALAHRIGPVALGEASVIVAASAAHRDAAFAGAREAIDRIKAEAPIWKRELLADGGTRWAAGELPRELESRADSPAGSDA